MSLRPEYLSQNLAAPIHTKDGGMLRTIQDACDYMAAISKEREQLPHWQHVRNLIMEEPDVTADSWQFRLAVLKDAKIDVSKAPTEMKTRTHFAHDPKESPGRAGASSGWIGGKRPEEQIL
jgi:hypothetical protein